MTLRPIKPMAMPDVIPGGADMAEPTLARVKPTDLLVDETYQRNLSERSVTLIRKMVAAWDWNSFQFPLCVKGSDGRYHVVDGQHTAIAAATHPKIDTIPIVVIDAKGLAGRAQAFIGRNRDRIIVTPNQLHYAAVAAGEARAVTIDRICKRAGIRILKYPPGAAYFKAGDTLAIGSVSILLKRHGEKKAREILKVCGDAKLVPVSASVIRACEFLLTDPDHPGIDADDLATVLRDAGERIEQEARVRAASEAVPVWKAIAALLIKRMGNGRRRAA